jgi:hypothetical protein
MNEMPERARGRVIAQKTNFWNSLYLPVLGAGCSLAKMTLEVASYALLVFGAATTASALYLMLNAYTTVPYWDEWGVLISYQRWHRTFPLQWIWEQNNEHRIVWQKLFLVLDYRFLGGQEWPMFLTILLSQCALLGVLVLMLRKVGAVTGWPFRCALGVALYCLFCPAQWENYTWGFQLSFVLVNFLVVSAVVSILVYSQSKSRPWLIASLVAAAAAAVCNANGPLVWPITLLCAVLLRLSWRSTLLYVIFGSLLTVLYFYHYTAPTHHASPLASIKQPLLVIEYMEKYFGSSFLPTPYLDWSGQVGTIAIALGGVAAVKMARYLWGRNRTFTVGALAIMAYLVLTAFVTALGRINFGTDQAFSSRYQSYALLFWFFFFALTILFLASRGTTIYAALISIALIALFAASALFYGAIVALTTKNRAERELGEIALMLGVHDDDLLSKKLWPSAPQLWDAAELLRGNGLSIFATQDARQLTHRFRDVYGTSTSGSCQGFVDEIVSFKEGLGGMRVTGWAATSTSKRPATGIIFVNDGSIAGYGVSGFLRRDVGDALGSRQADLSGWIGYVSPHTKVRETEVYALIKGSHRRPAICRVAQFVIPSS